MSSQDIANVMLRLLGILLSWPVIVLVVILIVRSRLPDLVTDLSHRLKKAGPLEFAELKDRVNALAGKVQEIEEKIAFAPSPNLTPALQRTIESALSSFRSYLQELGFVPEAGEVQVSIDSEARIGSYYDVSQRRLVIAAALAGSTGVALREYANHALFSAVGAAVADLSDVCIELESGLAYYFPSSFSDNPASIPYVESLENEETFQKIPSSWEYSSELQGEIWGAAFWELRKLLGQAQADRLLFTTWSALTPSDLRMKERVDFVRRLLEAAPSYGGENYIPSIQTIFERRGLRF